MLSGWAICYNNAIGWIPVGEGSLLSSEKDGQDKQPALESVPTNKGSGFDPATYPTRVPPFQEPPSVTASYPPQMATQATMDAHVQRLQQHIDDSYKLAMSEIGRLEAKLGGQIELIRRDVNDLQAESKDKKQKRWDSRIAWFSIIGGAIVFILIEVAKWLFSILFKPSPSP